MFHRLGNSPEFPAQEQARLEQARREAQPLVEVMLEGVSGIADYQCGKLLGGRYHRLAPVFPPGVRMPLDAVARVPEMVAFAEAVDLAAARDFLEREWI